MQYVRGELDTCKEVMIKELERSKGRNEFALFTKVSTEMNNFVANGKFSVLLTVLNSDSFQSLCLVSSNLLTNWTNEIT